MPVAGTTRLVGLIGNPVGHSLSPRMHNAAFAALGLDWTYVPLRVATELLGEAVRGLVALGFVGANVTIPHKTAVAPFCDELDAVARRCGSVNTLVVGAGRVFGSSTDGLGVTSAVNAREARVLMLGAGGAAQAVATALLDAGAASLAVSSRRRQPAEALAGRLQDIFGGREIRVVDWPPGSQTATLVVNSTPIRDAAPVPLRAEQQIVDLAYLPDGRPTTLVDAAKAAGCARVVDGFDVLVGQGAASFERWTGLPAPVDVMRAALRGTEHDALLGPRDVRLSDSSPPAP